MPVLLFFIFIFIASFVHMKADTKLLQVHSFEKEKFAKEDISFSSLVSPEKVIRYKRVKQGYEMLCSTFCLQNF